jgi:multiple RNA-binding domain-containing protein 1
VVLPPARTIAIVEFADRNEAKVAFRKLAYKKFKNLPLYLEWAPVDTFTEEYSKEKIEEHKKVKEDRQRANAKKIEDEPTENADDTPTATVFVKNLNFETTEEVLKKSFEGVGGLRSVRISTKPNPKMPGKRQSMGFGFLEFNSKEDAMSCIKGMQKFILDGHELILKYSNSQMKSQPSARKRDLGEMRDNATKLLIRNLPFEATKKDLKTLFSFKFSNLDHLEQLKLCESLESLMANIADLDLWIL